MLGTSEDFMITISILPRIIVLGVFIYQVLRDFYLWHQRLNRKGDSLQHILRVKIKVKFFVKSKTSDHQSLEEKGNSISKQLSNFTRLVSKAIANLLF